MLRKSSLTRALLLVVFVPLLLLGTGSGRADDRHHRHDRDHRQREGPVRLLKTIPVPVSAANTTAGALYSFDISWVDQATGTYYLADRSNKAVDSVEAETVVMQIAPNTPRSPGLRRVSPPRVRTIVPVLTASWPRSPGSS